MYKCATQEKSNGYSKADNTNGKLLILPLFLCVSAFKLTIIYAKKLVENIMCRLTALHIYRRLEFL